MQIGLRIGSRREQLRSLLGLAGRNDSATGRRRGAMVPALTIVTPLPDATAARPDPELRFTDPARAPGGEFAAMAIPNGRLRPDMVPGPGASWETVEEFALTYDGHAYWSDVAELGSRGLQRWTRDGTLYATLDELRGSLFYEQRRWHHFGEAPVGRAGEYVRAVVDAIQAKVRAAPAATVRLVPSTTRVAPTPRPRTAAQRPTAAPEPPAVTCFADDEAGYQAWSEAHRTGFVLNAPKTSVAKGPAQPAKPKALKVHRAACPSIAAKRDPSRSSTATFRKVCASDLPPLLDWSITNLGTDPEPCQRCRP